MLITPCCFIQRKRTVDPGEDNGRFASLRFASGFEGLPAFASDLPHFLLEETGFVLLTRRDAIGVILIFVGYLFCFFRYFFCLVVLVLLFVVVFAFPRLLGCNSKIDLGKSKLMSKHQFSMTMIYNDKTKPKDQKT